MRFSVYYFNSKSGFITSAAQPRTEVAADEETEQVFSRQNRKAYREEILGQRTAKAKRGNAKRKARALGKEGRSKAKACSTS